MGNQLQNELGKLGNELQNGFGKLGNKLQNRSGKSGMRYKRTWEVRKIGAHVNKVISLRRSINDLLDVSRLVFGPFSHRNYGKQSLFLGSPIRRSRAGL